MRVITNSNYISHTDPIFKKLEILKLCDLYKLQGIKLYCSAKEGKTPSYIASKVNESRISHTYNTRNVSNTFKTISQNKLQEQTLNSKLDKTWNVLPRNIKDSFNQKSNSAFVKIVKNHFLSTYSTTCNKRNSYSCGKQSNYR